MEVALFGSWACLVVGGVLGVSVLLFLVNREEARRAAVRPPPDQGTV
jgi:hypothetical protein